MDPGDSELERGSFHGTFRTDGRGGCFCVNACVAQAAQSQLSSCDATGSPGADASTDCDVCRIGFYHHTYVVSLMLESLSLIKTLQMAFLFHFSTSADL